MNFIKRISEVTYVRIKLSCMLCLRVRILNRQIQCSQSFTKQPVDKLIESADAVLQTALPEPCESKIGEKAEIKISILLEQKH